MDKTAELLLSLVPADGSAIGNKTLWALFEENNQSATHELFEQIRNELVSQGYLVKGRGRGGSVRRAERNADNFDLSEQTKPKASPKKSSKKKVTKKKTGKRSQCDEYEISSYRHKDKRANNPPVGMVTPETDRIEEPKEWRYDPHIAPELQFDVSRSQVEKIIDDALASEDEQTMREALATLKRMSEPFLNWTGKAERTSFEVDTVSLHVHERIDPATVLANVKKRLDEQPGENWRQSDLFSPPFENLPLRDAIEFYKHEKGWANRLIAGDSLLVMNSLLQKEGMAGQVQMIYIDPPYGIKYGSNFQPFVNKRDVKDRKDQDLTQEPEMIKAFRDTWELGVHSYLSYLRDRLLLARELLSESGSVFVQISDENIHHVKEILDEIFGEHNLCAVITFQKTAAVSSPEARTNVIGTLCDYIIWFAKDISKVKYHQLYLEKGFGIGAGGSYKSVQLENGKEASLSSILKNNNSIPNTARLFQATSLQSDGYSEALTVSFVFNGKKFKPNSNSHWKTTTNGLRLLKLAQRLRLGKSTIRYIRFIDDFPAYALGNIWTDMMGASDLVYVVQTNEKVIERCLQMTTDPGDLVLDPTCGSGTTAFVAEKWGRRWITCDTSRVAVTLAKQRLMTASYDYYTLRYPQEGLKGGFNYKTVPHVTLKSIANNPEIDEIYEKMHSAIEGALVELNHTLQANPPAPFKISVGARKGKTVNFTLPKSKKVTLPSGEEVPAGKLLEWEVPFDFPDGWPQAARKSFDAFHHARMAMQEAMDASIAAHANHEILYDQPEVDKCRLRITGPFTMEAVPFATVLALEEAEKPQEADVAIARSGETTRIHQWLDELLKTGIRGKGGQMLQFAELELLPSTRYLHAIGTLSDSGETVAVSFGPEFAPLEQRQVAMALDDAQLIRPAPKYIIFAAFEFDPEAAKDIDETNWPGITLLKAQMNTDLLTEDLKKKRSNNQSFWLMGQPDVELRRREDGKYEVEVHGFDYFDTRSGELVSGGKGKIALWMLDTDYDNRSLFPSQTFFPMAGKKDGWHKLKKNIRAELNEDLLEQYHGTVSLPFKPGEFQRVAVKIIDDRGIESLKILPVD